MAIREVHWKKASDTYVETTEDIDIAVRNDQRVVFKGAQGEVGSAAAELFYNDSTGKLSFHNPNGAVVPLPESSAGNATGYVTVVAGSIGNVTISSLIPTATLDDVTLIDGDLVVLKNQTNQEENGIYAVSATGGIRDGSYATYDSLPGLLVVIQDGTVNADTVWLCTSNRGGDIDVDPIVFTQQTVSGELLKSNNLSDLTNFATARENLGVEIGVDVQAHSTILDNTTASYTSTEQAKLAGIEEGAKTGDVVGPASATNNAAARFDTTGKLLKNSSVFITDAGSVGIGTGSPVDNFHVLGGEGEGTIAPQIQSVATFQRNNSSAYASYITVASGSAADAGIQFGDKDNTLSGQIRYANDLDAFEFYTNTTQKMTIDSNGKVGIGINSPSGLLDVYDTFAAGTYGIKLVGQSGAARDIFIAGQEGYSNGFTVQYDGSEMVYSFRDGKVGIGTTSPQLTGHIYSTAQRTLALETSQTTGKQLVFKDPNTTNYEQLFIGSVGNDLVFYTGGAEKVRIDSSGNVGIGAVSPSEKLDVNGNIKVSGTTTLSTGLTGVLRADSGAVSVDGDVTDIVSAASTTAAGKIEIATTAEIDTGTDSTRAVPVDQFVASKRNIRWLAFNLVEATTDCATGTNLGGDFLSPIAGTILQSDTTPFYIYATNSTAGTTGTMTIDVNINGTTIMTTNKITIDTTEKTSTTAATMPDLTTTSLAVGDIITIDVDAVHTTAAKGLTVYLAVRE